MYREKKNVIFLFDPTKLNSWLCHYGEEIIGLFGCLKKEGE